MSNAKISDSLNALFISNATVFWHDVEGEFSSFVDNLNLEGVRIICLDAEPNLRIKLQIEGTPDQRWLLYSNQPEPEPSKDWLLDIRLRSKQFRADSASILLEDLGLKTVSLRSHLKDRSKFLRAKDRVDRLKRLVSPTDTAEDLDRKMLSVITRSDSPDLFAILQKIYGALVANDVADLATQSKACTDISNNDLESYFWDLVKQQLGYTDPNPSLRDLIIRIMATDFCRSLIGDPPRQLAHFVLPERSLGANASVFVSRWPSCVTGM